MLFDCFCLCFEALKKSCSCLEELFAFGWPPFDPCRYESLRNPSAIPWDRKYIKDSISRYYQMWRTGLNSSLNLIFFPVHSINLPLNNYSCSISHTGHKSLDHSVRRMGPLTLTYKVVFFFIYSELDSRRHESSLSASASSDAFLRISALYALPL